MQKMQDWLTQLREVIRCFEDIVIVIFGLVLLLMAMWSIIGKHWGA
jgi:hypothetical protein